MLGFCWDNGKQNGNYYSILRLYWDYMEVMENKMETIMAFSNFVRPLSAHILLVTKLIWMTEVLRFMALAFRS